MVQQLTILAITLSQLAFMPLHSGEALARETGALGGLLMLEPFALRGGDAFDRCTHQVSTVGSFSWSVLRTDSLSMFSGATPMDACINEDSTARGPRFVAIGSGLYDFPPLCPTTVEYPASKEESFVQGSAFPTCPTYAFVGMNSSFTRLELSTTQSKTAPMVAEDGLDSAPTIPDEIPPQLTPLSGVDAAKALRKAWKRATAQIPSHELLVILTAHWAHETAAGAFMFNHNFGGIKGRGPTGLSCLRGAREGFGWRSRLIRDRFRAYPNASIGADDYLSLLLRRYPTAIEAAEFGDASAFVQALHAGKYFTGIRDDYEQAIIKYSARAQPWVREAIGSVRLPQSPTQSVGTDALAPSPLDETAQASVETEALNSISPRDPQ